jgi:DNA mismatch repair protein MSH2
MPDLHRLAAKKRKGKATLEDLVRVYQVVLKLPGLIEALDQLDIEIDKPHQKTLLDETFIGPLKVRSTLQPTRQSPHATF